MPSSTHYWKKQLAGLCTYCGKEPAFAGTIACEKHLLERRIYDVRYRKKSKIISSASTHRWYIKNRAKVLAHTAEKVRRLKQEVVNAYGGQCVCCGETELVFLTLDHKNNDGAQDRRMRKTNGSGYGLYTRLKREGFPNTFQVLCANCNWGKYVLGRCPHERTRLDRSRTA
jgi:hypothetical protein